MASTVSVAFTTVNTVDGVDTVNPVDCVNPVDGVDPVDDVAAVVTVAVSSSWFLFFFGGGGSSCRGGDFLFWDPQFVGENTCQGHLGPREDQHRQLN